MLDKLVDYGKGAIKKGLNELKNKIAKKIFTNPYVLAGIAITIVVLMIFFIIYGAVGAEAGYDENLTGGMQGASATSWEQFIRYLHQTEGGGSITKNADGQDCYTVLADGGKGSAVGYGVDIDTHGERLRGMGYDTNIGSLIPVDVVDAIEKEIVEARYNDVVNLAKSNGINLTQYQIFALVSRTYNYGFIGGTGQATGSFKYPSDLTFVEAYKQYYSNINNDDYYGDYTKTDFNNELYTQYMTALWYKDGTQPEGWVTRRQSEWCLFQTGYYGWGLKNGNSYPVGFDEYCQNSGTYNSDVCGGIEIYNSDGSVNLEKMEELETYLTANLLNTTKHHDDSANQNGPFAKWWADSNVNPLAKFQCTWWANGRASQYLELTKSSVGNKYPTSQGHGKDYYNNNQWFQSSTTEPRANSIISWSYGDYGHVAYVEAVDAKTGDIWISHAGGGDSWFGIQKVTKSSGYTPWKGYSLNGFVYLDSPK